jgi:hypothetical protein
MRPSIITYYCWTRSLSTLTHIAGRKSSKCPDEQNVQIKSSILEMSIVKTYYISMIGVDNNHVIGTFCRQEYFKTFYHSKLSLNVAVGHCLI